MTDTVQYVMWSHAKARAKRLGVPFSLSVYCIAIPVVCPVLGMPLKLNVKKWGDDSPTLDRIVPTLGYIESNVRVISWRANRLKSDATVNDLEKIITYMKGAV
jgi:hypothetical protein